VVSAIVFFLSFKLKPDEGRRTRDRLVGVVLATASVIVISFSPNLSRRGLGVARPGAVRPLRPVARAVMIVVGIVLLQAFIA
jgi:hypothetical protein